MHMFLLRFTCLLSLMLVCSIHARSQVAVVQGSTPAQLAAEITGPGVSVLNVQYTGDPSASSNFSDPTSSIGLASGILLCTGPAGVALGPNQFTNTGVNLGQPGDAQLNAFSTSTLFDAAVLEFDFVPQSNVVRFRYVFASEEYPEWVCSTFNDLFAFFISGPGFASPTNIALIPGTTNPVAINSVNGGAVGDSVPSPAPCQLSNTTLYIDNLGGAGTEFDGYTAVLEAVATVIPCQTYHLKIVIADAGDGAYDSGVFLETGSLSSPPVVEAGNNTAFCNGGSAQLGSTAAVGWNYSWSPVTGLSSPSISNPTVSLPNTGNTPLLQTYVVTATNGSCVLTDSVTVTVLPDPSVLLQVSPTVICPGQSATVSYAGAASPSATFTWNFAGSSQSIGTGAGPWQVTYQTIGSQTISLVVSDNGCTSNGTGTVTVQPGPVASFTLPAQACEGTAVNLQFVTQSPGVSSIWNFGNANAIQSGPSSYALSWAGPGQQIVSLTVSENGCTDEFIDTIQVEASPEIYFSGTPLAGCAPLNVNYVSSPLCNGCSVATTTWNLEGIGIVTGTSTSAAYNIPGTYDVGLTVCSNQGCCTDTLANDYVEAYPLPVADFEFDPAGPDILTPVIRFIDLSVGAAAWDWTFGDGNGSVARHPEHTYADSGSYSVNLVVTSNRGCVDSVSKVLEVSPVSTLWIPSAFSPNGDGRNESFQIQGINLRDVEWSVFNRFGQAVFQAAGLENGWDGSYNSSPAPEGVYVYKVKVLDILNKEREFTGRIVLVR